MYEIHILDAAARQLARLYKLVGQRIVKRIRWLAANSGIDERCIVAGRQRPFVLALRCCDCKNERRSGRDQRHRPARTHERTAAGREELGRVAGDGVTGLPNGSR